VKLFSSLLHAVHTAYFQTLRGAERLFGPGILFWMLAPEILLTGVGRCKDYGHLQKLRARLPSTFHKGSDLAHFRRMFRGWTTGRTVTLFYDRLNSRAWKKRITVRGIPPHLLPEWGRQPVVVAFLHTGAFPLLRYWLRAQRIPVATYVGGLPRSFRYGQKFRDRGDLAYGLSDTPHVFSGGKSLRDALRFLKPGHSLLVALEERDFGKPPDAYSLNEISICLNQVAFRIACLANAVLMPAAVRQRGLCHFEITFGRPVPAAMMNEEGLATSNLHLLRELWRDLEDDASALTWTTLEALSPDLITKRGTWP
jgi:hypothetical protein